ncbi:glucokinase [Fulvivirga sedimenti]|uniref:Glucokinase n=1 Tax=Fulvivirga sedimenti TaxID=2879465 RepID=A0A9X1KV35_9BACT|nr:glucokinase [Fulvivirga sedimenti]MCA6074253.1 glucokinase [Fulvivirga sedimenti]
MHTRLSIAYPRQNSFKNPEKIVLAADIGGTKTNMALFRHTDLEFEELISHTYPSSSFNSPTEIIDDFSERAGISYDAISLAIAGPVYKQSVQATNLPWGINALEIQKKTGIAEVYLINDLEANAYGLGVLKPEDFVCIHEGDPEPEGNVAMISPGTGLGEAGMYWDKKYLHPFATEGGHCDFAPQTELDIEILKFLQRNLDHVSWERLVSGPGIETIFKFYAEEKKMTIPDPIREALSRGSAGPLISKYAAEGQCRICEATIDLFLRYLAEESGNLILKYNATGGLYIGGGIVPDIMDQLDLDRFLHFLQNSGRMEKLLRRVPVTVVLNEKAALLGAAFYGF